MAFPYMKIIDVITFILLLIGVLGITLFISIMRNNFKDVVLGTPTVIGVPVINPDGSVLKNSGGDVVYSVQPKAFAAIQNTNLTHRCVKIISGNTNLDSVQSLLLTALTAQILMFGVFGYLIFVLRETYNLGVLGGLFLLIVTTTGINLGVLSNSIYKLNNEVAVITDNISNYKCLVFKNEDNLNSTQGLMYFAIITFVLQYVILLINHTLPFVKQKGAVN